MAGPSEEWWTLLDGMSSGASWRSALRRKAVVIRATVFVVAAAAPAFVAGWGRGTQPCVGGPRPKLCPYRRPSTRNSGRPRRQIGLLSATCRERTSIAVLRSYLEARFRPTTAATFSSGRLHDGTLSGLSCNTSEWTDSPLRRVGWAFNRPHIRHYHRHHYLSDGVQECLYMLDVESANRADAKARLLS